MKFYVFNGDKGWEQMLTAVVEQQGNLGSAILKPDFQKINIFNFEPSVKNMMSAYDVEFGPYTVTVIMPAKRDQKIRLEFSENTPDEVAEAIAYAILKEGLMTLHNGVFSQQT